MFSWRCVGIEVGWVGVLARASPGQWSLDRKQHHDFFSLHVCHKAHPGVQIPWAGKCLAANEPIWTGLRRFIREKPALIYYCSAAIGKPHVVIRVGHGKLVIHVYTEIEIQGGEDSGTRNDWLISEAGEQFAAGQSQDTYILSIFQRGKGMGDTISRHITPLTVS